MVALLALAVFAAPQATYSDVPQFKNACNRRQSDVPTDRRDPAISDALDLLIRAAERVANEHPGAKSIELGLWLSPYTQSIASDGDFRAVDEFCSADASFFDLAGARFIVARMGAVTRSRAYGPDGRQIKLPSEFAWSRPWNPYPIRLKGGVVLLDCTSIQAMGSRVGKRLVWLEFLGAAARKVGEHRYETTLDTSAVQVVGDRVIALAVDPLKTFYVSEATGQPGRRLEWDCASGKPKLVGEQLLHPVLRGIDSAIAHAWSATRPTEFQKRLKQAWPRRGMLDEWSVEREAGGPSRVHFNGLQFGIRRVGNKCEVVSLAGG